MKLAYFCKAYFLLTFVFVIAFLNSCTDSGKGDTIVHGQFKNTNGEIISLYELNVEKMKTIDSVVVAADGSFEFRFTPKDDGFFVLRTGKNKYLKLIIQKGETVKVAADCKSFDETVQIDGVNKNFYAWDKELSVAMGKVDELSKVFMKAQYQPDFIRVRDSVAQVYKVLYNDMRNKSIDYIQNNATDLSSILVLNAFLGTDQLFHPIDDYSYFVLLDSCLALQYKNNPHYLDHKRRIEDIEKKLASKKKAEALLQIGNVFPDIHLQDIEGLRLSVNEEMNGEFNLVLVWASESPQSRRFMHDLKVTGLDKKLSIYAISMDRNPAMWKNAVLVEDLDAKHVCDGMGFDSPVAELLGLDKVPVNYLLDIDRKILAKNLTIQELEVLLK